MIRARPFPAAAFVAVAIMLAGEVAVAAPTARLVYTREAGAEDCPDEPALRAAVATRLGYDPFTSEAASTLFAQIKRDAGTYRAHVALVDEANTTRGARDLDHTSCPALLDALALTISIAIDPNSLTGPVPVSPVPVPVDPVAESPPPRPPPPPKSSIPAPHFFATLSPTATLGSAPSAAVGLVGGVGYDVRPFSLALEARGELPASREVSIGTVSTSLLAATVAPCFRGGIVTACALGSLGRIHAEARGIAVPREDTSLHVLGGGRIGILEPLTSYLDLRATADLLYAFTPQELRVDDSEVYSLPRVAVQLGLGLGLHFF